MRKAQFRWQTAVRDHVVDLRAVVNHQERINVFPTWDAVVWFTAASILSLMFVKKLPYIIFRDYPTNGYLTDNRNFGYDTASKSCLKVGDLLISKEGSIFYSLLDNKIQSVNDIAYKLLSIFKGVSYETLLKDAELFYKELDSKGFVVCKDDIGDFSKLRCYFSYENTQPCHLNIEQQGDVKYSEIFKESYSLSRVHLDISSRCNENCVHCYIPIQYKRNIMEKDVFEKILTQCVNMKVLNITLSGGEPMINPYLASFLKQCYEANISVNILSNLTYLSDGLLEIIASNPLVCVQTSLYAMTENIHDSITRKKGSFFKTFNSIKKLHDSNVPLQINCPIMKQNVCYYREVLDFAASLNIEANSDYILFGCYDSSKVNLGCRITSTDVMNILNYDYADEKTINDTILSLNGKKTGDDDYICSVCKSSLCISNTGDVYPCEGWQKLILGNINSNPLEYIWNELPLTKHLRGLKYQDFQECRICHNRKYCTTCLILNANENNGDYMNINPYMCELANIKKCAIKNYKNKHSYLPK